MLTLVDERLEAYAQDHTTAVPALLQELAAATHERMELPQMLVGRIEGTLLRLLVAVSGARRVVEVGTFTGFSALCMAAALPDDGELVTCEISEKHAALAREYFSKSADGHKIRLRLGPAIDTLRGLPESSTDLVFVDADKTGYGEYYEEGMRILRHGGLLVADNVLWSGKVLDPKDDSTRAIVAFNERVKRDPRVEHVLLPVRDGMMLARKR